MSQAAAKPSLELRPLPPRALQWLMLAVALAVVPHLFFTAPVFAIGALLGLGLRAWLAGTQRGLPGRGLLILLGLLALFGVVAYFHKLTGRDPGVALLLLMVGLKALETRNLRDCMLVAFLGYFIVITGFFYSQSIPAALYMTLVVVAQTAALIGLTQSESGSPKERLRTALWLLVQSIPMMIVLFLLFPRLPSPLAGLQQNEQIARTGLSDTMTPGAFAQLVQSNAVAFRATFRGNPPPEAARYWRGPVLWFYDGRTWHMTHERGMTPERLQRTADAIHYTVMMQPTNKHWVLALDMPGATSDAQMTADHMLLTQHPITDVHQYTVTSYLKYTLDPKLTKYEQRLALQLPRNAAPRARALAGRWRAAASDDAAVVRDALNYFHTQGFSYTLSPPPLQGDPIDDFLFGTRSGFCEYYAGSFVVLMRAAGIPARVVTGYLGGEYNPLGNYLLVRQSDAHAWAEVWLKGRGWVRVDPTAAVSPERVSEGIGGALGNAANVPSFLRQDYRTSLMNRLSMVWDSVNFYWNDWVVAFGPEKQRELLERLGLAGYGPAALIGGMVAGLALLLTL
jgi:transglutaminase-like putative cysteine protease